MESDDFRDRVRRLEEVNAVLSKLDPAIRADAFALLKGYVTGAKGGEGPDHDETDPDESDEREPQLSETEEQLIEEFESDERSENALLVLAVVYRRHGRGPFPLTLIATVGEELNLDLPDRIDMTFKGLKRDDKEVLRPAGKGQRRITPGGEDWLKRTYGIKRGKQPLPTASS